MPSLAAYREGYLADWSRMQVRPSWQGAIDRAAKHSIANRARYEQVERATGVPWALVATWHHRESGGNFKGVLHNGEHIIGTGRRTRLVPAGRGPFSSWHEAAIDALKLKGLHHDRSWPIERICYESERFNGFGYRHPGRPRSPYLWSGTNIYVGPGKFTSDGNYSPWETDQQLGCIPHYRRILELTRPAYLPSPGFFKSLRDKLRTGIKAGWATLTGLFTAENMGLLKDWFTGEDGALLTPENLLITAVLLFGAWYLLSHWDRTPEPEPPADGEQ